MTRDPLYRQLARPDLVSLTRQNLRQVTKYRYTKARWTARRARRHSNNVLPLAQLGRAYYVAPDGSVYLKATNQALVRV